MIYAAFYHGKPKYKLLSTLSYLKIRFFDTLTRKVTKGPYSHCEIMTPSPYLNLEGKQLWYLYSSSVRDHGVRIKLIDIEEEKWDFIKLSDTEYYNPAVHTFENLNQFFAKYVGQKYDLLGAVGVVTRTGDETDKWFCSEICAKWIGVEDSARQSPNSLYRLLKGSMK